MNPIQPNDSESHTTSRHIGGSPPVVETVVHRGAPEPRDGSARAQVQKAGRGKTLALFIIPGLLLLALILSYFFLSAMKSNVEQESWRRVKPAITALA